MGKIFKRGLIALAPVAISLAIIIWLFGVLEGIFRIPLQWLAGDHYFRGMGLLVAFIFIFCVGIVINNIIIQKFTKWLDQIFTRIPFFKTLYNSVGDMMSYFKPKSHQKKGQMVIIEIDSLRFLGILTREEFAGLPPELGSDDRVTVFVPLSYQIGGFTVTVPRSRVKEIDMSVEQGMRFVVTAGLASGKAPHKGKHPHSHSEEQE